MEWSPASATAGGGRDNTAVLLVNHETLEQAQANQRAPKMPQQAVFRQDYSRTPFGSEGGKAATAQGLKQLGYLGVPGVGLAGQKLAGEEVTNYDVGWEMAGVIPFGKVFGKVGRALANSPFGEAASRELATFFKNNANEAVGVIKDRLMKSIKSHEKQIAKHKEWVADPTKKYGDKWETFFDEHKSNILHHWGEDIKRAEAYKEAKQQALDELKIILTMQNIDYKNALVEIISMIRDKATYLKTVDEKEKSSYSPQYFQGMALAYHFVMDGIKTYIECQEDMSLSEFGLDDYDPTEILDYVSTHG